MRAPSLATRHYRALIEPHERVVTRLPLESVWDEAGHELRLEQARDVTVEDVKAALREGLSAFVVATAGQRLTWIKRDMVFDYWKSEVLPHFAASDHPSFLGSFPDGYCYFASEWRGVDGRVIVLTKAH